MKEKVNELKKINTEINILNNYLENTQNINFDSILPQVDELLNFLITIQN